MSTLLLTGYVLIWPIIVAFVLYFLARGFLKDWSRSRKDGRPII
ncbi:MAG TPA: putative transporter small subunit [Nocardiopsis listeri]|nr:putative transporter small subunit [Nocardiopsis listeri]HJE57494.1 putative transporter small subunit [Nocardiopsis listeri]